ncbi:N-6 DNA methylase [Methylomagnum sp.]
MHPVPHGVLFRGHAEADIRRNLVRKGYLAGLIGLPANLFFGTGIPACIVVIDKAQAHTRQGVFIIDASGGCMKDGPKNRLRAQDIHKIVDVFNKRLEIPRYSRMVGFEDIEGHLRGGIPAADVDALRRYWAVCPQLRATLFKEGRPGYLDLAVEKSAIKSTIYGHSEFAEFIAGMNRHFDAWRQKSAATLKALRPGCHPKEVIDALAEDLLAHYADRPLIDKYDVYQHLMDYWNEAMQDDGHLIAAAGWKAETYASSRRTRRARRRTRTRRSTRVGPVIWCPRRSSWRGASPRSRPPSTSLPPIWKAPARSWPSWRKNTAGRKLCSRASTRSTRPV